MSTEAINDLKQGPNKKEINMPGAIVSGSTDVLNMAKIAGKVRVAYFSIGPESDDSTAMEKLLSDEGVYIIYRETSFFQHTYMCVITYYIEELAKKDDKSAKESNSKV